MFPTITQKDKYIIDKIIDVINIKEKELAKLTGIWLEYEDNMFASPEGYIEEFLDKKVRRLEKIFKHSLGNITYHYGATKIVFWADLLPVVIKIPLSHKYLHGCINENYLEDEIEFCEMLREDDKEEFLKIFAETKFYKQKKGINYYLQGVVENLAGYTDVEVSKNAKNYVYSKSFGCISHSFYNPWLAKVYDIYGESFLNNFTNYIEENEQLDYIQKMLGDMHGLNYGYDVEGRPIIFDYAGFDS